MSNHVWSGCGVVMSIVGFAVTFVDEQPQSATSAKANMPIPKQAVAVLHPTQGEKVQGEIRFTQESDGVRVQGTVKNLTPGKHGFHIHEFGDLRSKDGKSAGGHFDPHGKKHGSPDDSEHHAGDLGNITANDQGVAQVNVLAKGLKLHFIVGRSIVVHGGEDDFKSQPSGDSGPRVGLGVIGFAGPTAETAQSKSEKTKTTRPAR